MLYSGYGSNMGYEIDKFTFVIIGLFTLVEAAESGVAWVAV